MLQLTSFDFFFLSFWVRNNSHFLLSAAVAEEVGLHKLASWTGRHSGTAGSDGASHAAELRLLSLWSSACSSPRLCGFPILSRFRCQLRLEIWMSVKVCAWIHCDPDQDKAGTEDVWSINQLNKAECIIKLAIGCLLVNVCVFCRMLGTS